jgi:hypothetical protein
MTICCENICVAAYTEFLDSVESKITMFYQQARALGFVYQPEFHRLSRQLLLDFIPPSLRPLATSAVAPSDAWRLDAIFPATYKKRILVSSTRMNITLCHLKLPHLGIGDGIGM